MLLKVEVEAQAHYPRQKQEKCLEDLEVGPLLPSKLCLHLDCLKKPGGVDGSCNAHGETPFLVALHSKKAHQDGKRSPTHRAPINLFSGLAAGRAGQQPKVAEKIYADHDISSRQHEFCHGQQLHLAHRRKQNVPAWKEHRYIAFGRRKVGPDYSH